MGSIQIPSSKSHTQRALLFSLMADGVSTIRNYLPSPDTDAMLLAIQQFGAKILFQDESKLEILGTNGNIQPAENIIDARNSGQVLRFIAALASLLPTYTILTGDLSIRKNRAVSPLLEGIRQLGGFAESSLQNDTAPIIIKGPIKAGKATLSGEDSQPVSALLMACSFLSAPTELVIKNAGEKPWIELTLYWMDLLGLGYEHTNLECFTVYGNGKYKGFDLTMPGDLSSAAFPAVAALITGSPLTLENIDKNSAQGDFKLFEILKKMGAHLEYNPSRKTLLIKNTGELLGGTFDINDCIDAAPILTTIGCFCKKPLTLENAAIARKKESNRISAMTLELGKMGALIEETADGLTVFPSRLKGTTVSSFQDHRVAMSLAVAGFGAEGTTFIQDVECIRKSYPNFNKDFSSLGFYIEELKGSL